MSEYHQPALLNESVDGLEIKPDGVYVDVTFGGGGHSREILKRLGPNGKLIAFDQDPDALKNKLDDPRFVFVDQNFQFLKNWVRLCGYKQVDGIIADLGVSSHQFDSSQRGFSIRFDAPLDMRMDQKRKKTAADILNQYEEKTLINLLKHYGEVENAHKIARAIIAARPVKTTGELINIINSFAPKMKEHKFQAQVFQALRIEVNEELEVLKQMLQQACDILKTNGRLSVISYHSLEDRLVKDFFKTGNFEGEPQKDFFGNLQRPLKPTQSKPIIPSEEEINENTRARSAKLRIAEKL